MNSNIVLVVDSAKRPMTPCRPAQARRLLRDGKAAVFRRFPFTLILKAEKPDAIAKPVTVKLDPGSKTTGIAVVMDRRVVLAAELTHRGQAIRDALTDRRVVRRNRRNRKTRYRAVRFLNRTRPKGWLAPSLMHRVLTLQTWIGRFSRYANVGGLAMELVKFDAQAMANPEITGVEYQRGELAGYEVREYLLEKWHRACAYCGAKNVPLQVEHIEPRAKGGSNRVSNLTLACQPCNQRKGAQAVEQFLKNKPDVLRRVKAQAKAPLKDAAAVNTTRWRLFEALRATGLPVEVGTGGRTKFNRTTLKLPKAHWIDAACVGESGATIEVDERLRPLQIVAKGQGPRQKAVLNKFGYPINHRSLRPIRGWRNGDLGLFDGKVYRVTPRQKGSFELGGHGKPFSRPEAKIKRIHRNDGYTYA